MQEESVPRVVRRFVIRDSIPLHFLILQLMGGGMCYSVWQLSTSY